uniref:RAI1-like domain-containing protein n=1 Tax=Ditylenchus dipsaci TaxID=166011 RepID=A0A915CUX2_9BILA
MKEGDRKGINDLNKIVGDAKIMSTRGALERLAKSIDEYTDPFDAGLELLFCNFNGITFMADPNTDMNDYGLGKEKQKNLTYWSHNFKNFVSSSFHEDYVNPQLVNYESTYNAILASILSTKEDSLPLLYSSAIDCFDSGKSRTVEYR